MIIDACREDQYSYEYRHGVTSYGAFTYALARQLRRGKKITFNRLVEAVSATLANLGYKQEPQILGPRVVTNAKVPWSE